MCILSNCKEDKDMMNIALNLLLIPAFALGYLGWAVRKLKG